ncbi:MAG: DEAD/DEAH box helicase [Candidatus Lokiarchaeota archaeon]|nr:DEAD/DEAH box helicase [Candidatus Lokiarchaeota archaeon]MBD3342532.1 DEAD/DEAH box helicase [Candidatus Lokiarchaeota archaeon]
MIDPNECEYIKADSIQSRQYQIAIAEKCVGKNSLVVLPTGLGKTIIAVLVAAKTLELFPPDSKIVIMAPTRPLINQHYESFLNFLTISEDEFTVLTGKVSPDKRAELFQKNRILFYTPQTLRNDLVRAQYDLTKVCLIIFDEVHHASGDYPYTTIAELYAVQNPDGNILSLTASPGASKERIAELCHILRVSPENTHFRTRKDHDVKNYLKPMDIYRISVELTELMKVCRERIYYLLEQRLQYLSQLGFLEESGTKLIDKVIRKDLLKLNTELVSAVKGTGSKTGLYAALSVNAQALILYHILELIEQQGLDNVLDYLERKVYQESLKKRSSKAVKVLASEQVLKQIYLSLKKAYELDPEHLIHPKHTVLAKILEEEISKNPAARIVVFVKLRVSVKNIVNKLRTIEAIKPVRFVGQATKSKSDKGLSQKKQIEILKQFKEGEFNVLVSTNVGEEGLDIAECDMVVFYDVVASEIRLIQRKGRTARHRAGKVVILYTSDTNDEVYLRIAMNKLKRMDVNLRNPGDIKNYYEEQQKELLDYENEFKEDGNDDFEDGSFDEDYLKQPQDLNSSCDSSSKQSNLASFAANQKKSENLSKLEKSSTNMIKSAPVKLSQALPVRFGLRRKLADEGISFEVRPSKIHIELFSKVIVQVFSTDRGYKDTVEKLRSFVTSLDRDYDLIIAAVNFTSYKENIEGERRLFRQKIEQLGKHIEASVVPIDNEEELRFIVKGVLDYNSKNL